VPYIPRSDRAKYDSYLDALVCVLGEEPPIGDLNYVISRIILGLLANNGLSYTNINSIVGALECCKLELYRRVAANYEDQKERENGGI